MATTKLSFQSTAAASVITDTDSDDTPEANVNTGGGVVLMVIIDNSVNTHAITSVFWDRTTTVTFAAGPWDVEPDFCFYTPASTKQTYICPQGMKFGTGITFASTQGASKNKGSAPTVDVKIELMLAATDLHATP